MSSIPDLFFQIILFLAGAIVGVFAQILGSDHKKLKTLLAILAIFLVVTAFVWTRYEIAAIPFPTQTLASLSTPTTSNPMPLTYDDFNNPVYDNSINSGLWERIQDLNCDVKQENGTAVFRLNNLSKESTLCYLHMPNRVELSKVGSVESMLLTENNASGDYSIGVIEFKTTGFSADGIWIAQCGIIQTPKENKVELFFYVNNSYPNGNPEVYKTITASTEQWYKMRLEIDPYTGAIWCFTNDKILGSLDPTRVDFLKSQLFSRHILGFWSPESTATFKADNVVIKP